MKMVENMRYVAYTSWLVLLLALGLSPETRAEVTSPAPAGHAADTRPAPPALTPTTSTAPEPSRPVASPAPNMEDYDKLLAAIETVKTGFEAKNAVAGIEPGSKKDLKLDAAQVESLKKALEAIKSYRKLLVPCADKGDKGAADFGKFLDDYVAILRAKLTEDPKKAAGLSEREIVTYTAQAEKFFEKKLLHFATDSKDFRLQDVNLKNQLETIAKLMWAGSFRKDKFTETQALGDATTKPIVEKMSGALRNLESGEKTCKLAPAGSPPPSNVRPPAPPAARPSPSASPRPSARPTPTPTDEEQTKPGKKTNLVGGPLLGGNKEQTPPTESPSPSASPSVSPPPVEPPGPSVSPVPSAPPFQDPGLGQQQPGLGQQQPGLGNFTNPFLNTNNDDNQDLDQIRDAIDALRRAQDDIDRARAEQAAIDANQRDNNDAALAEAIKALGNRNDNQPQLPQAQSPISPPSGGGDQGGHESQPPPQPPQDQPPPQQQGMPFIPQSTQASQPPIVPQNNRPLFDNDPPRRQPIMIQDPNSNALLEYIKLQQQILNAQQQARMNQFRQPPPNTMAYRLQSTGSAVRPNTRFSAHPGGRRPRFNPGTTGAAGKLGINPNARASTVPATLTRRK